MPVGLAFALAAFAHRCCSPRVKWREHVKTAKLEPTLLRRCADIEVEIERERIAVATADGKGGDDDEDGGEDGAVDLSTIWGLQVAKS